MVHGSCGSDMRLVSTPDRARPPSWFPWHTVFADTRVRVLLVDDVFDIRFLIRTRLEEEEGVDIVGEAADPDDAVRLATALQPEAVITDLFASVADAGYLARLRGALPQSCIVLCSAASRTDDAVVRAFAEGANGYLDKGEGFAGIGQRLLEVCEGNRRPSLARVLPGSEAPPLHEPS